MEGNILVLIGALGLMWCSFKVGTSTAKHFDPEVNDE